MKELKINIFKIICNRLQFIGKIISLKRNLCLICTIELNYEKRKGRYDL